MPLALQALEGRKPAEFDQLVHHLPAHAAEAPEADPSVAPPGVPDRQSPEAADPDAVARREFLKRAGLAGAMAVGATGAAGAAPAAPKVDYLPEEYWRERMTPPDDGNTSPAAI